MTRIPALQNRDYRRFLAGAVFSAQGMSGEQVVIGLLVYVTAGSTAWVGITLAIYFLPFFVFGILSGAIADWIDRRTLLRWVELGAAATLALFAASIAVGDAPLWLLILFTLCLGSLRALHQPVRSSYAYDLVGETNVVSGVGLLNIASRAGQLLGALVAGGVMHRYGAPAALACLAAGHLIAFLLFRGLRTAGVATVATRVPIGQNFREFFSELHTNRLLLILLAVTASVEIFGFSFATVLPQLATDRLDLGAEGLGYLQAIRALAGIVAGLAFATLGIRNRTGAIYLGVILTFGVGLIVLSYPTSMTLIFGALFLVSLCMASCDILSQIMMQLSVANALRGRAMGIWVLALGIGPLGHLELAFLTSTIGMTGGLLANGFVLIMIAILVTIGVPRLRRL